MKSITLPSHAKINLRLEIVRKRDDGYHDIKTLLQKVSLSDEIYLSTIPTGITVVCDHPQVPANETNLAYAAAQALLSRYHLKDGIAISIKKNIPVAAGLGGGSSNAATTLAGINQLFALGASTEELMKIGSAIGADVPFFLFGNTALATGIGDKLETIHLTPPLWLLLITPPLQVSTTWAYRTFRMGLTSIRNNINIPTCINHLTALLTLLSNDLEKVVIPRYPVIQTIKEELFQRGARGSLMSGSGSTVYGIFSTKEEAQEALAQLKGHREWKIQLTSSM